MNGAAKPAARQRLEAGRGQWFRLPASHFYLALHRRPPLAILPPCSFPNSPSPSAWSRVTGFAALGARPLAYSLFPFSLVLLGLALGFLPGMPRIELRPDLVLSLFLPPLLYRAGSRYELARLSRQPAAPSCCWRWAR